MIYTRNRPKELQGEKTTQKNDYILHEEETILRETIQKKRLYREKTK